MARNWGVRVDGRGRREAVDVWIEVLAIGLVLVSVMRVAWMLRGAW
jgi:hypothetical protein